MRSSYYTCCMPLAEENRLGVTRDCTTVGLRPARPCNPDGHSFRVGSTVPAPKASTPEVVSTLRLAALGAELANGAESIKRGFPQAVMA